jgi:hypothetical protein
MQSFSKAFVVEVIRKSGLVIQEYPNHNSSGLDLFLLESGYGFITLKSDFSRVPEIVFHDIVVESLGLHEHWFDFFSYCFTI